ncbi:bone morphogenetic protein 1-like [Tubulanus polymorphus]|uniref:bone morphogenetic protein 1-like n=1 Tax=Tubulanus polymorphus TaxID=672921 RepID=UPI003DA630DB
MGSMLYSSLVTFISMVVIYSRSVSTDDRSSDEELKLSYETVDYYSYYPRARRFTSSTNHWRSKRAVTAIKELLWPNATIPYIINSNITDRIRSNIHYAISHWENLTCIRFVERTAEKDFIEFTPGACGCCSFVGRRGNGVQFVNLSPHCAIVGVVIHEIGHVVGFWHEHSRPDRDKYIRILLENVNPKKRDNFEQKRKSEIDSFGQPYDYASIMHYKDTTFSLNGKKTLEAWKSDVVIGQRIGLSKGDVIQSNLLYDCPKPNCSAVFEDNSGNFSSPNYPLNYYREHSCIWVIRVPRGHSIKLVFDDFDIEFSKNCSYDYVEIRQGNRGEGQLIGRLCGLGQPGDIRSVGDLWIRFQADASVEGRGFLASYRIIDDDKILDVNNEMMDDGVEESGSGIIMNTKPFTYRTDCQQEIVNESEGFIISPLIMALYNGFIECSWTLIGGPDALGIKLELDSVYSENPDACFGDLFAKSKMKPSDLDRKTLIKEKFLIEENDMFKKANYDCKKRVLTFNTNEIKINWSSQFHKQFRLLYVIDYDECKQNKTICEHKCINTFGGYTCHCTSGFLVDPHNNSRCVPKQIQFADSCGSRLVSVRGKLRSSTEPEEYCVYEIKQSINFRVTVAFFKFVIPYSENCTESYIEVFARNEQSLKGRFCGNRHPNVLTTPTGYIKIVVYTNVTRQAQLPFFTASYIAHMSQKARCFYRYRGRGNVTSPAYPDNYHADNMCIWKISARGKNHLVLKFHFIDIESTQNCGFDYVEVRDGRHRRSPFIGKYCGKKIPPAIISSGRHLWVMFASDGTHNGKGFMATFDKFEKERQDNWTNQTLTRHETEIYRRHVAENSGDKPLEQNRDSEGNDEVKLVDADISNEDDKQNSSNKWIDKQEGDGDKFISISEKDLF